MSLPLDYVCPITKPFSTQFHKLFSISFHITEYPMPPYHTLTWHITHCCIHINQYFYPISCIKTVGSPLSSSQNTHLSLSDFLWPDVKALMITHILESTFNSNHIRLKLTVFFKHSHNYFSWSIILSLAFSLTRTHDFTPTTFPNHSFPKPLSFVLFRDITQTYYLFPFSSSRLHPNTFRHSHLGLQGGQAPYIWLFLLFLSLLSVTSYSDIKSKTVKLQFNYQKFYNGIWPSMLGNGDVPYW